MKLKNILIKFLITIITFELGLDILMLIIPLQMGYLGFLYFQDIIRGVIFILLLNKLYKHKIKFGFVLLTVLVFPIVIHIIQVGLGNILIHFCPQQIDDTKPTDLLGLINSFTNNCPFPTRLNFSNFIDYPIMYLYEIFTKFRLTSLLKLFFCPYIYYFFLFFKFSLFKVFVKT